MFGSGRSATSEHTQICLHCVARVLYNGERLCSTSFCPRGEIFSFTKSFRGLPRPTSSAPFRMCRYVEHCFLTGARVKELMSFENYVHADFGTMSQGGSLVCLR